MFLPKWAYLCGANQIQQMYTTGLRDGTQMNVSCMENEAPLARTGTRQFAEAHNEEISWSCPSYCSLVAFEISAHDRLILMSPFHLQRLDLLLVNFSYVEPILLVYVENRAKQPKTQIYPFNKNKKPVWDFRH